MRERYETANDHRDQQARHPDHRVDRPALNTLPGRAARPPGNRAARHRNQPAPATDPPARPEGAPTAHSPPSPRTSRPRDPARNHTTTPAGPPPAPARHMAGAGRPRTRAPANHASRALRAHSPQPGPTTELPPGSPPRALPAPAGATPPPGHGRVKDATGAAPGGRPEGPVLYPDADRRHTHPPAGRNTPKLPTCTPPRPRPSPPSSPCSPPTHPSRSWAPRRTGPAGPTSWPTPPPPPPTTPTHPFTAPTPP